MMPMSSHSAQQVAASERRCITIIRFVVPPARLGEVAGYRDPARQKRTTTLCEDSRKHIAFAR